MPTHFESRTDATPGEPLAVRALQRKAELEEALAKLPDTDLRARNDIELALASVGALLTGDLEHVARVTGEEIGTTRSASSMGQSLPRARSVRIRITYEHTSSNHLRQTQRRAPGRG
jgi:hypothetical protein